MTVNQKKKKKKKKKKDIFEIFNSWNTLYLYSVGILVLCTLNTLSPVFSGINNNNNLFLPVALKEYEENAAVFLLCFFLQR